MRDRMLSSPRPDTLGPKNAVTLHAWQNAIIAPPRHPRTQECSHVACVTECYHRPTQKPYHPTMHSCYMRVRQLWSPCWMRDRLLSSPPRNPITQQCSHVACVSECYDRHTQKPYDPVMLNAWPTAIIATQKPYHPTMQSCCMRVRMLWSPYPETLWPSQSCWMRDRLLSSPPRNPITQQCSHVACVSECYDRHTQKPYDPVMLNAWPTAIIATQKPYHPTMQSCCMRVRMLWSPYPETLWPSHVECVTECYHRHSETLSPNNAVMLHAWPNRNPEHLTKARGLLHAPNQLHTLISGRCRHRAFKEIELEMSPSLAATDVTPASCLDESEPACPSNENSNSFVVPSHRNFQSWNLLSFRSSDWVSTTGASWHQAVDTMADTGSFGVEKYGERRCKKATVFLCSFIPSLKTNPGSILVLLCQTLNHFKMHVCFSWIRLGDAKFQLLICLVPNCQYGLLRLGTNLKLG